MNSNVYAPRPARSNWGRVIYNVLHDAAKPLTRDEIWSLIPAAMHVSHSKRKFVTALGNMAHKGFVMSYKQKGTRDNKYSLARVEYYNQRKAKIAAGAAKYNAKKRAKLVRPNSKTAAARPTLVTNSLVNHIDGLIKLINERIEKLVKKRTTLEAMLKAAKRDDGYEQSHSEFEEDDWVTVRY